MIPILFEEGSTDFSTNGIGRLTETTKLSVRERRNGVFEGTIKYPISGKMYKELSVGRVIYAVHDETKRPQPFDIYNISEILAGEVTVSFRHATYRLSKQTAVPFEAQSCADACDKLQSNILGGTEFSFWTDKTVTKRYVLNKPQTVRSILGGQENSFLDVFGTGEYEWDHFTVKLHRNRGSDNGVTIRYAKNLKSLERQRDNANAYNAVVPYYLSSDGELVTLPEWAVYGSGTVRDQDLELENGEGLISEDGEQFIAEYSNIAIVPLDLSNEWEDKPTVAQLRAKAVAYLADNTPWVIDENIKIDFVQLWQTEEYKNVAPLQRIRLCDWVYIIVPGMNIVVKAQCIYTEFDGLNEHYTFMELGKAEQSFTQTVAEIAERNLMPKVVTRTEMDQAIYEATNMILGGEGGYIVDVMVNGHRSETLIMDQPSIEESTNIIRFNKNGIGFSNDGGTSYRMAWTIDGRFNASFIVAGQLIADLIKGGMLSDKAGVNTWNMDTGELTTKAIRITEIMQVIAGLGSYFKMPISESEDDFLEIRNTAPQFRIIKQASWGGAYIFTIDPEEGVELNDGDFKLLLKHNELILETILGGMSISLSLESFRKGLILKDGSNETVISPTQITTTGTKNRIVNGVPFYAYETLEGYFGDIGEGIIGADGYCTVPIADTFRMGVTMPYQVFLQSYGDEPVYVYRRHEDKFIVKGMPRMRFAYEIKAKQINGGEQHGN